MGPFDPAWIEAQLAKRTAARSRRDFATADQVRDELAGHGVVLEDGPDGTRWQQVPKQQMAKGDGTSATKEAV